MRFFLMARAHYARFGFSIRRVLTDNGSCYKHWLFRRLLHRQHVKHRFTRPYTPRTNGKAERFIQTASARMGLRPLLPELRPANNNSTSGCTTTTSTDHTPALTSIPPASRSGLNRNNLLSLHIYRVVDGLNSRAEYDSCAHA